MQYEKYFEDIKKVAEVKKDIEKLASNADVSEWIDTEILTGKVPLPVAECIFARNILARSGDDRINETVKQWAEKKLTQLRVDNVRGVIIPSLQSDRLNTLAKRFIDFDNNVYRNSSSIWFKMKEKEDMTLFCNKNNKVTPYVVAYKVHYMDGNNIEWEHGTHFDSLDRADRYLNKLESEEVEDLVQKVNCELNEFKIQLQGMLPDEIFNMADKVYFMKELDEFFNGPKGISLVQSEADALMKVKVADTLFNHYSVGDELQDVIKNAAQHICEDLEMDADLEM